MHIVDLPCLCNYLFNVHKSKYFYLQVKACDNYSAHLLISNPRASANYKKKGRFTFKCCALSISIESFRYEWFYILEES